MTIPRQWRFPKPISFSSSQDLDINPSFVSSRPVQTEKIRPCQRMRCRKKGDPMTANWFDKSLETQRQDRILKRALLGIYLLILGIVIVGGITRLTNSGLSMVDWRPVTGLLPPMSEASWMEVFDSYQKSPEGSLLNQDMGLREFKWIFFLGVFAPDAWTACRFGGSHPIPLERPCASNGQKAHSQADWDHSPLDWATGLTRLVYGQEWTHKGTTRESFPTSCPPMPGFFRGAIYSMDPSRYICKQCPSWYPKSRFDQKAPCPEARDLALRRFAGPTNRLWGLHSRAETWFCL